MKPGLSGDLLESWGMSTFHPHDAVPTRALPSRARILVADQDGGTAELFGLCLQVYGHETRHAMTGQEAIATAVAFQPGIAFMDLDFPDMNGFVLAAKLRAVPGLAALRICVVTAWPHHTAASCQRGGFDGHFHKPVEADKLDAWITEQA